MAYPARPREARQEVALLEVELAEVRHPLGVVDGLRVVGKEGAHLLFRLHVRLLPGEAEALRVVEVGARPDGQEHVVRLGVLAAEVVRVVGGHHAETEVLAQPEHPLRHEVFLGDAVLLDLQPEAVRAEALGEPGRAPARLLVVALPQVERHLAREAGGQADDPLGVRLEHLLVDPRAAVEALREPDGAQLDEVLVAGAVLGQENEVAVEGGGAGRLLALAAGAEGEVRLEAEDGADLGGLGRLVERPGRMEVAVVGDRQAVHAHPADMVDQRIEAVGAVEERVFAVGMEVGERHGLPDVSRSGAAGVRRDTCGAAQRRVERGSGPSPRTRDAGTKPVEGGKLSAGDVIVKSRCDVLFCSPDPLPEIATPEPHP